MVPLMKKFISAILLLFLCLPCLSGAEVTLQWDRENGPPYATGYYLYQSTTAPTATTEYYVISDQVEHTIITSPFSNYMDDGYVDGGVTYANGTALVRESTAGLGVATATPANVASIEFYYHIAGVQYLKAAVTAGTVPGDDVIPEDKYGAVAFDIGTNGVIDVIEAAANATGYESAVLAIAGIPAAASDHVRMGTVTAMKSDGAFTFGTTALNATNVTATFNQTPITLDAGEYWLYWNDNKHQYVFNPADAGQTLRITYSYTPLVKGYETFVVPSSTKVSLAHKPKISSIWLKKSRRTGQRTLLTTAGIEEAGVATFNSSEIGQSVDVAYVYTKPLETNTVQVTLPTTIKKTVTSKTLATDTSVTVYNSVRLYGSSTSVTTSKLVDSVASFTGGVSVQIGHTVVNRTTGSTATVTAVDSATQLSLSANIFTATSQSYHIYATSTATSFSKVANNPATGQYALTWDDGGEYTFNTADSGKVAVLSYTYTNMSTVKQVIPGGATTCKLRNPAGTYYIRISGFNDGYGSAQSNMVSYTQAADDTATKPRRIRSTGTMQKDNLQPVTVGY